jgi:hypothetical protein
MKKIELIAGDVFCSSNPMWLGRAINAIQWFWSKDGESKYSHAGIILDGSGTTLEALWTVSGRNIFDACKNDNLIIARPDCPRPAKESALDQIMLRHSGQWYPFWRLLFHLIPPMAKVALFDRLVCSELTAQYLFFAGVRHKQYKGTNPDMLADEWRRWKNFDVILEGMLS